MTLKFGIAQAALPGAASTTFDLTDASAGFSTDLGGAIILATSAIANNTLTANSSWCVGLNGESNATERSNTTYSPDADASGTNVVESGTIYAYAKTNGAGTLVQTAPINAMLTTGYRFIQQTATDTSPTLVNTVLLGGTIQARLLSFTWTAQTGNKVVAHGLSGTPVALIGMVSGYADGALGGRSSMNIGFWANGSHVSVGQEALSQIPTSVRETIYTSAHWNLQKGVDTFTVGVVDATNVNINFDGASASTTLYVLAIYDVDLKAAVGTFTSPTSVSTQSSISGLSFTPQCVLVLGTALQVSDTSTVDDTADAFSFGAAVKYTSSTGQCCISRSLDYNATPNSVSKNQTSNTRLINGLDSTGASQLVGTVASWGGSGVSISYTSVAAAPLYHAYLALGHLGSSYPLSGKFGGKFRGKF